MDSEERNSEHDAGNSVNPFLFIYRGVKMEDTRYMKIQVALRTLLNYGVIDQDTMMEMLRTWCMENKVYFTTGEMY